MDSILEREVAQGTSMSHACISNIYALHINIKHKCTPCLHLGLYRGDEGFREMPTIVSNALCTYRGM